MCMEDNLKNIINGLYKPPIGKRQAVAMSRRSAEQLPLLMSIGVISITTPERELANLASFPSILRLSFADVDFQNTELSIRAKGKINSAFNQKHAGQICDFIESLPSEICSVVVHCEGGYSRSTAVVQALHDLYGFQVNVETLKQANPSILSLLRKEGSRRNRARY